MTIIIFILILGILVLVHECGHFLFAKKAGVRVDEFGFGYPPRALTITKKWGTIFTLNWVPFGGFVKIFGENYTEEDEDGSTKVGKSFTEVSKISQALILVAGVLFNFIFACFLFALAFMSGMPTTSDNDFGAVVENPKLTITSVMPNSPASEAQIKSGDVILSISDSRVIDEVDSQSVSDFINSAEGDILLSIARGDDGMFVEVTPQSGIVSGRKAIGISMDTVGTVRLPFFQSLLEGVKLATRLTKMTVTGLLDLVLSVFKSETDLSGITGPIGIVGLVGDASRLGFVYLLTFTALISINLAVINLIPFPALDGGRLLFVLVESIKGSPLNPRFASMANLIGFIILIVLMVVVTAKDISNLL